MTVVFSDENRVTWFVCPGVPSRFCEEFVEPGLVTFQRAGRRDVVLAPGVSPDAVEDPERAKAVFDQCEERRWTLPGSRGVYAVETGAVDSGRRPAYRLTSPAMVHVVVPGGTKPVGLLTDEELAELVDTAFGATTE